MMRLPKRPGRGILDRKAPALGLPFRRLAAVLAVTTAAWGCGGGGGAPPASEPWAGDQTTGFENEAARQEHLDEARMQAAMDPGEPFWPYHIAAVEWEADSLALAESWLLTSLGIDPGYAPALSLLSNLLYQQGRHTEAVTWLEGAQDLWSSAPETPGAPFPPELVAALALHLEALGETVRSEELAAQLQGQVPDGSGAGNVATYVILRSEDYLAAAEPARRAVERDPENAINQNNFGVTRLQAGDPMTAHAAFMTAHELDPELPGPLYNLAIVEEFYFLDHEAGHHWFQQYWELSQEDPDGLWDVFETSPDSPAAEDEAPANPGDD